VHEDAAWQRKYLCLVLHAPEWGREDKAVVVALEFGAVVAMQTVIVFLAETLIGDELKPVHYCDEVKSFMSGRCRRNEQVKAVSAAWRLQS
jgi:hypothetical protein